MNLVRVKRTHDASDEEAHALVPPQEAHALAPPIKRTVQVLKLREQARVFEGTVTTSGQRSTREDMHQASLRHAIGEQALGMNHFRYLYVAYYTSPILNIFLLEWVRVGSLIN